MVRHAAAQSVWAVCRTTAMRRRRKRGRLCGAGSDMEPPQCRKERGEEALAAKANAHTAGHAVAIVLVARGKLRLDPHRGLRRRPECHAVRAEKAPRFR